MRIRAIALCAAIAVGVAACGASDDLGAAGAPARDTDSTSSTAATAPERQASTTTTAFDPGTVEGQVEAAYLKSWDVYAQAVYDLELDEEVLAEVYAGEHLQTKRDEIARRVREGRAALVRIEHDYVIDVVGASTAIVIDRYRNHQVLIDPETKKPVEDDPDEEVVDSFTLRLESGSWHVTYLEGLR